MVERDRKLEERERREIQTLLLPSPSGRDAHERLLFAAAWTSSGSRTVAARSCTADGR